MIPGVRWCITIFLKPNHETADRFIAAQKRPAKSSKSLEELAAPPVPRDRPLGRQITTEEKHNDDHDK